MTADLLEDIAPPAPNDVALLVAILDALASLPEVLAAAVKAALETAQPLPPKMLFTAHEASEITGLPVSFFEDGSAAQHLPSRKVGLRYRRYSVADLEFIVEASGVAPTGGPLLERWSAKQKAALRLATKTA
jgi:hypothetical protein